jgi:hypothetical protein
MQLYDRVFISPPANAVPVEHRLYLAYALGPFMEGFGQIVIPTGLIEITRVPASGEAAVGRVVKMFGEVLQSQHVMAYDTSAALVATQPAPVINGRTGKIRWMSGQPVLPSIQKYIVLDLSRRDGLSTGDRIELYEPRQPATERRELALPEIAIGRAQVLRVTPYGSTAIIISQDQPKIQEGTAVRVTAKMP